MRLQRVGERLKKWWCGECEVKWAARRRRVCGKQNGVGEGGGRAITDDVCCKIGQPAVGLDDVPPIFHVDRIKASVG